MVVNILYLIREKKLYLTINIDAKRLRNYIEYTGKLLKKSNKREGESLFM